MIHKSLSVCAILGGLCCAPNLLTADEPSGGLELTAPRVDRSAEATTTPIPSRIATAPQPKAPQPTTVLPAELRSAKAPPRQRRAFSSYIYTAPAADEDLSATETNPASDATTDAALPATGDPADKPQELDIQDATALATPQIKLSPEMEALGERLERTLDWYYTRPEKVAERSVWGVMHSLIAYGVDTEVIAGNRKVNAIGWICYNGPCRGQQLFYLQNGQLTPRIGPGVQGHHGQFLAMLAQSRVKTDFPLRVEGKEFTVQDLIEFEKRTCYSRTELTFKLIALAHYLPSDATWKNDRGEDWDMEKLIREELAQPIVGAACGGTHRLTGISYAVNKRKTRGEEFKGEWLRAQIFEKSYQEYIYKLQNRDGSFSTEWFAGRADSQDDNRKIQTTGHMLEWLVYSLPDDQLQDPRLVAAVNCLNEIMWRNRNNKLEIGPQGHALHALILYQQRLYGAKPGQRNLKLATQPRSGNGK